MLTTLTRFSFSQDSTGQSFQRILKVSPMNLIFFYPSLQLAYEHQVNRKVSWQGEAGLVFPIAPNEWDTQFQNKRGTKLKIDLRYYPMGLWRNHVNYYMSVEPYFNMVNFDREINQTECLDVNCTTLFQHRYNFVVKYREEGVGFKNGLQINKGWFTVDFSAGLRARFVNYKKPSIAEGIDSFNDFVDWSFSVNENKRTSIGIFTDIKLCYTFGGKRPKKEKPSNQYIEYF